MGLDDSCVDCLLLGLDDTCVDCLSLGWDDICVNKFSSISGHVEFYMIICVLCLSPLKSLILIFFQIFRMAEDNKEVKSFKDLGICEQLVEACENLGWKTPSKIQAEAIPHALEGLFLCFLDNLL